ncbi:MAG: hypothetical protein P0120_15090 [Nitrospira sp.]|nr:hypothetical protein [Nitrospira sp.]
MAVKDRVKRHRAIRRQQNLHRLDVWTSQPTITEIRRVAGALDLAVWSVVENALKGYIAEYRAILAEGKGLREQRDRLLPYVRSPGYQDQVQDHQHQVAAYKTRLDRFLAPVGPTDPGGRTAVTGNETQGNASGEGMP